MSQLRRLPVYLVLDCSESMAGDAIESVARGVRLVHEELRSNPLAMETAYLSVITFNRYAKQVVPLTEVMQFTPPKLSVRTGSALGAALSLLLHCLRHEVVRSSPTTRGDYKPLVFLLTDGQPTDDWEPAADAIRSANNPRIANIYAIGCGPDVDTESLRRITDIVLSMADLTPEGFRRFFIWISASVASASARLDAGGSALAMPPLPDALEVAPVGAAYRSDKPRQVFLQARCQKSRQPYLMRFARQGKRYEAIAAHPLEVLEEDAGDYLPPIKSNLLDGCPECPYCGNEAAGMCDCGALFCSEIDPRGTVVCPGCRSTIYLEASSGFKIRRSQG